MGFSPDAASEHCASRGWRAAAKYNAERLRWEESTGGVSEEGALAPTLRASTVTMAAGIIPFPVA